MEEKPKLNLKQVTREAVQASRKFRDRVVFINKNKEDKYYTTSFNQKPESVAVYRNGSEIAL